MKIYLVDFENVKSKGLSGIEKLDETDNVIIFYSENSDTISFEMHQKVLTSKAEIEYFKVNVGGKNALDFQLSTLLGYLVAKNLYSHIFIISNDRGFDFLHDFWHGKYVDTPNTIVYRTRTISSAINFAEENKVENLITDCNVENLECFEQEETYEHEVVSALADIPDNSEETLEKEDNTAFDKSEQIAENSLKEQLGNLLSAICSDEDIDKICEFIINSTTKEEFHNSLAKVFKQQATEIYKLIRPKYLKLKELFAMETSVGQTDNETVEKNAEIDEAQTLYHDVLSEKILQLTHKSCSDEDLEKILSCLTQTSDKRQFYIKMVKAFRKKKGCEYYNMIRSEYTNLTKQMQEI